MKPNTNYILEFDYWADADNVKFDIDLFPDVLPQTQAIAKTNVQTYRWELSSSSEYMTTANLRFFNSQSSINPANIYITNIRLSETNKTLDNILGGTTAIGMMASGNFSGSSAVDVLHAHTGNTIKAIRLNLGAVKPIVWSPQMEIKKDTEYIVEFDYWSDSDKVRFNVDFFPDELPEINPIANKNIQHYKWRINSRSESIKGVFLRFFNDTEETNPANIYITNIKLYEASKVPEIGKECYYIRNGQGDIISLIDDTGKQVVSYSYNTWGRLIKLSGEAAESVGAVNPYRYRGYRYDSETGLYYLQSRYYNPELGRFINADGLVGNLGELLSFNMFAYCGNNPVNNIDPSGKFFFAIPAIVAIVAVEVVAVVTFIAIQKAVNLIVDTVEEKYNMWKLINQLSKVNSKASPPSSGKEITDAGKPCSKTWNNAKKKIKEGKGKGINVKSRNEIEAEQLINDARPELKKGTTYEEPKPKASYEKHEIDNEYNMPHIKW